MTRNRYNKLLLAVMLLGLLASLVINWQRHAIEQKSNVVELTMDYEEITELARTEGEAADALFQRFREAGIVSLAVYETTLEKLHREGRLSVLSGANIQERLRVQTPVAIPQAAFHPEKVYIIGKNRTEPDITYDEVRSDLIRRLGAERIEEVADPVKRILAVNAFYDKLIKWNLGLSSEVLRDAAARGFSVVVRPTNYTKVRPDDVDAVFARLSGVDNVSGIMFVGQEVLGYPHLLQQTADNLKQRGVTLMMIEHPLQLQFDKQDGLLEMASMMDYRAARVYIIPKEEQPKLRLPEAINRWGLSDQERNIRVNLLKKYEKPEGQRTVIETNLAYVAGVKAELESKGFVVGPAGTFPPYFPHPALLVLAIAGATAAGVLYLTLLLPTVARWQYGLLIVLTLGLSLPVLMGGGTTARQMAALASANLFPVLAMTWQLDRWQAKKLPDQPSVGAILKDGVFSLTITVLLSLAGGLYLAALLGDVRFLLEMEIFRGVKLTFVMPLVLISLIYVTRYPLIGEPVHTLRGFWDRTITFLNYPIRVKTLVVGGVAALAAYVLVGRSGHTAGLPVPAAEIKLRALLEQVMFARPRSKEFLIGHPAFLLAAMAVWQRWPQVLHYILVVAATIGQSSLVETFAHLRTPVSMSVIRALDGLLLGALIGLGAVIACWLLQALSRALGRRLGVDE